jgi:outer membrane protein TolC
MIAGSLSNKSRRIKRKQRNLTAYIPCSRYCLRAPCFHTWFVGAWMMMIAWSVGCRNVQLQGLQSVFDRNRAAMAPPDELRDTGVWSHDYADTRPIPEDRKDNVPDTDPPEPADGVLTLEAARALAVRGNPDVHAAAARLEMAVERVREAQSRYYPAMSLNHTTARTFQTPASRNRLATLAQTPPTVPVDLDSQNTFAVTALLNAIRRPLFGIGSIKGNTNPFSEHSTSLTASWTLFDGYIREAQVLAAKYLQRASAHSLNDVRRLIARSVEAAYYQVQLAKEEVRIARADESFSREQLEETEKLRQAGRASQTDVGNFRVRMLAAAANVSAAIGRRETGRVILAELMGWEHATLPSGVTLEPLTDETEHEMNEPDVEGYVGRAMASRPDLRQFEELLESRNEEVRIARGAFSPVVTLSGSYGFDHSETLKYSVQDQSSAGAFEVRWEVFTGGARAARLGRAESSRAETAANLARLRLAVHSEVRSAVIAVVDAQRQIRLQRENVATAAENRRVVRAAYAAGRESLTRLNEVQRDFILAEVNLALARIRLRQAWSDLYAASGMPPVALDGNVAP